MEDTSTDAPPAAVNDASNAAEIGATLQELSPSAESENSIPTHPLVGAAWKNKETTQEDMRATDLCLL